jgi:phosphatidylserine/phosphatidylglycerophosphate/cardiolipin synthase-like enzyme
MNPRSELLQSIVTVSVNLDSAILEGFCEQLEKLPTAPTTEHLNGLGSGVVQPEARAVLTALVKKWRKEAPDVTPRELSWAIRAGSSTDECNRARQSLELVWTGPASIESNFRRTDQALLALIQQAKTSIIIVTFAAYKVPHIEAALVAASARDVKVTLILESMEDSGGKVTVSAITGLGNDLAQVADVYVWPFENRDTDSEGKHGSLHVKCAVADATIALISSANLTEYAMHLNMELGLIVKGGDIPRGLDTHLCALIRNKVVIKPFGNSPL